MLLFGRLGGDGPAEGPRVRRTACDLGPYGLAHRKRGVNGGGMRVGCPAVHRHTCLAPAADRVTDPKPCREGEFLH